MTTRYLYSELACLVDARLRCGDRGECKHCGASGKVGEQCNHCEPSDGLGPMYFQVHPWFSTHTDRIEFLVREHMPSGSGFDNGTTIDLDHSHADKLVFNTAFHHMDDNGYYCGWTDHQVIVTPSLVHGFHVRVGGRNVRDIKDYIHEAFSQALETVVEEYFERLEGVQS